MRIKIKFNNTKNATFQDIDVRGLETLEELAEEFRHEFRYRPMMAKVNGIDVALTEAIRDGDSIEFIDATCQAGNLVYQRTISMVFLKAADKVIGDGVVRILNPLNKGLFIKFDIEPSVTEEQLNAISQLMDEYVANDEIIAEKYLGRVEAIEALRKLGYEDKAVLIEQAEEVNQVCFHTIDDYSNFFYGIMAPSTGYVDKFQLMPYGNGALLRFPYTDNPNVLPEYHDDVKLYHAFADVEDWDKLLGINYVADLNKVIIDDGVKDMVLLSEALHEKRIAEIADMITKNHKRIVLIAGPSSSGKTSFARRLCVQLKVNGCMPLYMGTDDYFVEREDSPIDENGEKDYENLDAMDLELFNNNMNDLLDGKTVDMPVFNFITGHKEFGKRYTKLNPNGVLVVEGIHALNEAMSSQIAAEDKFKIYISPLTQLNVDRHNRISTTDARMLRRIVRDYNFRGHSAESTINGWPKVRAGEDKNIFPYNGEADVLFNSVTVYELALLKKHAQPLLEQVDEDSPCYSEARRLASFLQYFRALEEERYIPNNSIMREFIGGSVLIEE